MRSSAQTLCGSIGNRIFPSLVGSGLILSVKHFSTGIGRSCGLFIEFAASGELPDALAPGYIASTPQMGAHQTLNFARTDSERYLNMAKADSVA